MGISAGSLAMGAQGAGAAMSTVGAYFGAKSRKMELEGQAAMSDLNAQQSELAAQQELAKGNAQIAAVTARAGQVKGSQRAAMAANGIDLGEGSAAEVLTSTDIMKEEDVNTISANAVRAAWGQRIESTNHKNDALMKRAGARGISPGMSAFSSLLGSASQVATSWYSMNKAGAGVAPKGT